MEMAACEAMCPSSARRAGVKALVARLFSRYSTPKNCSWRSSGRQSTERAPLRARYASDGERVGLGGIADEHVLARAPDIGEERPRQPWAAPSPGGARRCLGEAPGDGHHRELVAARQQQGAALGARVLDGHPQQRGHQPLQDDLAGDGLLGLDHGERVDLRRVRAAGASCVLGGPRGTPGAATARPGAGPCRGRPTAGTPPGPRARRHGRRWAPAARARSSPPARWPAPRTG